MKLLNCKVNVPKMYQEAIQLIERDTFQKCYTITLKGGYNFSFGGNTVVANTQKDVVAFFKQIVIPVSEKEITPLVAKTLDANVSETTEKPKRKYTRRKKTKSEILVMKRETEEVLIATSFLKGEMSVQELNRKFSPQIVSDTLKKYDLKSYNYANFKSLSNSKIFSTLRFYKRFDLVGLFEKSYNVTTTTISA